jgi:type IV secretion system protein VirD4
MGYFGLIMLIVGGIFAFFRFGAGLWRGGLLVPLVIFMVGMLYVWTLDGALSLVVFYAFFAVSLSVWLFINYLNGKPESRNLIDGFKKWNKSVKNTKSTQRIRSFKPSGVVFGKSKFQYVTKPEDVDGHVLVVGGVGSGKTSCVGIPSLLAWRETLFCIDIKGELYEKSRGKRKKIKVFNPLLDNSFGYDPYYLLRNSENRPQEARAIAQAIIPLPHEAKEPFWIESAQNLFTACILHYSEDGFSFLDTMRFIQGTPAKKLIKTLCQNPEIEAKFYANNFLDMEDKVLSGIVSEISKNVVPFITDKDLIFALSRKNNITPEDLEQGVDIFIQIPEHLLRQWKNLLTLIASQFLTHFEKRNEQKAKPILFLLDEFPRLGKIGTMLDGLATLRSKKISICLIIQSLAQLDVIYGKNERKVILDTCAYKAILGATDADTQDYFSQLVGNYDKIITNHGENFNILGLPRDKSTNTNEQERRTIKPEEFGVLDDIVLLTPHGMMRVNKAPYYAK